MSAIMLSIGLVHFDGYLVGLVSFCVARAYLPRTLTLCISFVFDRVFLLSIVICTHHTIMPIFHSATQAHRRTHIAGMHFPNGIYTIAI